MAATGSDLRQALRIARAVQRFEATVSYDDQREPIAKKVQRWQRLTTPELPVWAQEVRPHDPSWAERFSREAARLRDGLGSGEVVMIEHFGSSSIPHLASKPMLDILAVVRGEVGSAEQSARFATLGYGHFGNSPCDREADWYWNTAGDDCILVVHVCDEHNPWPPTAIDFRDFLRLHPEECSRYEALKRELRGQNASLLEYSIIKLALFYDIVAKAEAWRATTV